VGQPEAVVGLATLMESPAEEICRPAFRLFSNLLVNSYEETDIVIRLLERKLPHLLKRGLLAAEL